MARKRKLWRSLSRTYRDKAAALAAEYGLSRRQARERYNRGTFQPFAKDHVPFKTKDRFIPKPKPVGGEPAKPPGSFDNDKQRRVYRRIMGWFPNDGYYLINGKKYKTSPPFKDIHEPSYHSSQGISWHPGNPLAVYVRCLSFTNRELDSILDMSREDFRSVASANMKFWYH